MSFKKLYLTLSLLVVAGLLSSCVTTSSTEVQMPPSPPEDRIQSKITSAKPRQPVVVATATPVAPVKPATPAKPAAPAKAAPVADDLPEGISLNVKGRDVTYTLLNTVKDPAAYTVTVVASPTTPFSQVEKVMDRLHKMGFMINFSAGE